MNMTMQIHSSKGSDKLSKQYEIHIAANQINRERALELSRELTGIGITEHDYFSAVYNVRLPEEGPYLLDTPPVGHDLEHPVTMHTQLVDSYEEACALVLKGMNLLKRLGINGNFEIETVLHDPKAECRDTNVREEFPGYQEVHDAPKFEFHIIWNGDEYSLPTYGEIIQFMKKISGYAPNQIVDFAATPDEKFKKCRVSTVYLETQEQVAQYLKQFNQAPRFKNLSYIVGEKVNAVAESIS